MVDSNNYQEAVNNLQLIDEWIETARSLGRNIPNVKIVYFKSGKSGDKN